MKECTHHAKKKSFEDCEICRFYAMAERLAPWVFAILFLGSVVLIHL